MAKLLKLRRGTTSQHSSFTGAEGEVTVDTDKETLVVHNGSSAAGFPLARESALTSKADLASPDFTTDITLKAQAPVKFEDDSGGEFVGLKAPTGVTSYTVTLPATAPSNGQVLKATSATALGWSADTALSLLDEDNFATNSATAAPSQQSTKAYVDAHIIDEDNFASDSATKPASQQSIKAYITATSQPLDSDTAKTDVDQEFTKPQRGDVTVATHSSGATYDFDLDTTNNFKLTISAAVELGFSNLDASREGQSGTIYIDNGAITPTWGDEVQFEGGTSGTISVTQSKKSVLAYYVIPGGSKVLVTAILDVADD